MKKEWDFVKKKSNFAQRNPIFMENYSNMVTTDSNFFLHNRRRLRSL